MPRIRGDGPPDEADVPAEIARDAEVAAAVTAHAAASDPHTGYQRESEKDAANGYAGLDADKRSADLGPAASKATYSHKKSRSSGDISTASSSWADLDSNLDLTVTAKAGDVLLITLSARWSNEAVSTGVDAATMVSGSPVNYISGGAGGASHFGVQGWFAAGSVNATTGTAILYTVQAGDVSAGTVTLRLRYRGSTSGTHTMKGDSNNPIQFGVVNLG